MPRARSSFFKTASDPKGKPILSILSKGWKVKNYTYATRSFIPVIRRLQPDSTVMVMCVANAFCLIQKALVRGHPRDAKKVSVTGTGRLQELKNTEFVGS